MSKRERRKVGKTVGNAGSVFGGHRSGKRRKGTSVLKVKAKDVATAPTFIVKDEFGVTVGTLKYFRSWQDPK